MSAKSQKNSPRKIKFLTDSGITIRPVYSAVEGTTLQTESEVAGEFPYTRGIYADMYRSHLWTMRQYSGFASAQETNARYRFLLSKGQTGLSTAFDLPTQMGYDSDHELSEGEVGKTGVAVDSLKDMEDLFDRIPLAQITTSMTINATAAVILAFYIAVAKKQNADLGKISGTIQNDILKEYVARGTYIYPPQASMRLVKDIFAYCTTHLPKWHTISISGYHIREAGANAVQELAFTFANAIAYVSYAVASGMNVDEFGANLSFFFACHNNFFEEIAKFRAARRIWAKIMQQRFSASNSKALLLRFHTQTAGSSLTAQQPDNNIVRVTLQALAAVLGGTQSLHTNSKDEALALPTEDAARIALRTQQIIAYESGVTDTVDPLGGAPFVESLTNEIEARVWQYLETVDAMGGALVAIENKYFQNEIAKSAYTYQKSIESKERVIVGVNDFIDEQAPQAHILKVTPDVQEKQIAALHKLKKARDNDLVGEKLSLLRTHAEDDRNLMPIIIECVEAYATLGEISDTLRQVFGVYRGK